MQPRQVTRASISAEIKYHPAIQSSESKKTFSSGQTTKHELAFFVDMNSRKKRPKVGVDHKTRNLGEIPPALASRRVEMFFRLLEQKRKQMKTYISHSNSRGHGEGPQDFVQKCVQLYKLKRIQRFTT